MLEPLREHHGRHDLYGNGIVAGTLFPIVTNCTEFHTIGSWESTYTAAISIATTSIVPPPLECASTTAASTAATSTDLPLLA